MAGSMPRDPGSMAVSGACRGRAWMRRALFGLVVTVILVSSGCASTGKTDPRDPFEAFNRSMFEFNDALDRAVVKPVAKGYRDYVPEVFRFVLGNMFANLADVWTAVNNLLQGKPGQASSDLSRVLLNTTFGFLGAGDVASELGIERNREDFGQTLGRWGVPSGPYLVLPFFGPSSVRDGTGFAFDSWADPLPYALTDQGLYNAAWVTRVIDKRASLLPAERLLEGAAFDKYLFIRDGYLQRRRNLVYDGNPPLEKD